MFTIIKILLKSFLRFLRQSDKFGRNWHIFVIIVCERGTKLNSQKLTSSGEFKGFKVLNYKDSENHQL